jgi:basic membrane lipoprotein Med (substrate-binding protein (PBP1-ABC) superfamily)
LAEINAFAIGASMIDPEARITLVWTGRKNYDWEADLTSQGISVISGKEFITPRDEKRRHGLYRILPDGSAENLAAPMQNWGRYYALIIESILTGAWESKSLTDKSHSLNYWYGISSGVIDVIYSKKLSYNTLKLLELLKDGLVKGTISPFDGELRSREGIVKAAGSDRLTYEEILSINWLNENVDGEIPPAWEMKDSAKKSVSVAGVKK